VILFFRDIDAKGTLAAAEASKKKKDPSPKRKGFKSVSIEDATLTQSDLKTHAISKLKNDPVPLKEEHIRIYTENKNKPNTLVRLGDHEQLRDGATYFALEVFTTLPTNVYRTVRLDQIYPATLCHPKCQKFTKVSPFMTAAMSEDEQGLPWHALTDEGELVVRGVSVFWEDERTKIGNPRDPYLDVQRGIGTYSIDLGTYEQLARKQPNPEIDPVFGLLETTITHKKAASGRLAVKNFKISVPAVDRQKQQEATEQSVLFRFKLEQGTDLSKYGMAVVYDNLGPNECHCSLVRESPSGNEHPLDWIPIYRVHRRLFAPRQIDSLDGLTDQELKDMLSPRQVHEQPEIIDDEDIAGQSYSAIPKLAALFELQDFIVKARAEPLPPDTFDDSDARALYYAGLILFLAHSVTEDFYWALQMLEAADYKVGSLDGSVCKTLIKAMENADVERDLEAVKARTRSMGLDIEPFDALHKGIDILSRAM